MARRGHSRRRSFAVALALFFLPTLALPVVRAADDGGLVVRTMKLPTSTPGDLAWDGEALWLADWDSGELLRLDPGHGAVLDRVAAPCYRPRGLAWDGDRLYVCDEFEGRIYVYDPRSGVTVTDYATPNAAGLGLAWDGDALWLADNGEHDLYRLIPSDGTALTYFDAPRGEPGGLAFDGTYLWVAHRYNDRVYAVDPKSGTVITGFDSPGPYPCGLAAGPDGRLWLADFEEGLLYLLAPREARHYQTSDWRAAQIRVTYRIENHGPGDILDAKIHFAVAEPSEQMRLCAEPVFGEQSPRRWVDQWGQPIATFERELVKPGERFEARYRTQAEIGAVNYIIFPEMVGSLEQIPADIRAAYTVDGERLQVESDLVRKTVGDILGDERHPYWIARKIFDWVIGALEYEMVGGWDVPETLIRRGTGSCSEYAFLYIALCRAAGLPARYEAGAVVRGDDTSTDDVHHRWAEVYLPPYGWIPIDPSGGDQPTPGGQADAIGRLPNRYFVTTRGGGGSQALGWSYNARATYSKRGRCAVTEDEWFHLRRAKEEGGAILPLGERIKP
jgi:transglutaminase-like putative cysteine protease/DNA-binding beta-propeller fold protein YncE